MNPDKIRYFTDAINYSIDLELSRTISYGCVNYFSNGSHKDMDYKLLLASKNSIIKSIKQGNRFDINDFNSLRKFGLTVEKNMFSETGGINTHKGLIFLLLFLIQAFLNEVRRANLEEYIENFSKELKYDYKNKLVRYPEIIDIRQIPISGYAEIKKIADKQMYKNLDSNYLTLYLISIVDDTTTISRSNLATLRKIQKQAKHIFLAYNYDRKKAITLSHRLNYYYLQHSISSGGVADIYSIINCLTYLRKNEIWT